MKTVVFQWNLTFLLSLIPVEGIQPFSDCLESIKEQGVEPALPRKDTLQLQRHRATRTAACRLSFVVYGALDCHNPQHVCVCLYVCLCLYVRSVSSRED